MNHFERNSATNLRMISQESSRFVRVGSRQLQLYLLARTVRRGSGVQLSSQTSTQTYRCKSLDARSPSLHRVGSE